MAVHGLLSAKSNFLEDRKQTEKTRRPEGTQRHHRRLLSINPLNQSPARIHATHNSRPLFDRSQTIYLPIRSPNQNVAAAKLAANVLSLNGTVAATKSAVLSAD